MLWVKTINMMQFWVKAVNMMQFWVKTLKIVSIVQNSKNPNFFQERAILTSKNEVVQEINDRLLSLFPRDENEYLSSDSLCHTDYLATY